MRKQFKSWLCCQVCGRVAPSNDAEHWLNQPHRERWDVRVVRCPQHWTDWALRNTREGRSNENRERMREALSQPEPKFPSHVAPFPTMERDAVPKDVVRVGRKGPQ